VLARLAAAAVAATAAITVCLSGTSLEDATVDARFALRHAGPADDVVVIAIDDASIGRLGAWPFRRRDHARAIERLHAAGVRGIVYDVQFTEPSPHPSDDLALYNALGDTGGAVLATSTSDAQGHTRVLGGDDVLAEVNSRAGAANFDDHVIRRYPERVGRLPSLAVVTAERLGRRPAPFGNAWIDFRSSVPAVSFADLLAGRVPRSLLRNRVAVVGATAPTLQDRHATAVDGSMAGPVVQANAIWTALHGNPLRDAPAWLLPLEIALFALAIPLLSLRLRLRSTCAAALALAAAGAAAAQLAFAHGVIVAVAAPLAALAVSAVGTLIAAYVSESRRRRHAAAYGRALEREVAVRTSELRETQLEVLHRLSAAAERRDDETGAHLRRMSRLCGRLARAAGLDDATAEEIEQASLLHDVGKIGIPDDILRKPGRLTEAERAVMQTHTTLGAELLAGSPSPLLRTAEAIARTHHERWDGTGYPAGLAGEAIPLAGRIAAICDVFDALLTERPYKRAWTLDETLDHIAAERGRHFDPELAAIFLAIADQRAGVRAPSHVPSA
jgi:response regulator RpfG family c-di-GMP phosphodiesterase